MITKKYVEEITNLLIGYVGKIDTFVKEKLQLSEKLKNEMAKMQGKYTSQYIEEYKNNYIFPDYTGKMNSERSKHIELVNYYLETIEKQLDSYFMAPVRTDFSNKVNAIKITNLMLSDLEFKMFAKSAKSYMEMRLLNQLAETRTKTEFKTVFDSKTNEPKRKNEEVASPYMYINVPDMDKCYDAFESYKRNVNFLLANYSGKNAELAEFLESGAPNYIAISADSYFRNKVANKFLKVMEEQGEVIKKAGVKRELTDRDKKVIDALINEPFPELYKEKVKERLKIIAAEMPEVGILLRLDERYNKYLD